MFEWFGFVLPNTNENYQIGIEEKKVIIELEFDQTSMKYHKHKNKNLPIDIIHGHSLHELL